jgi:hypothetical protein
MNKVVAALSVLVAAALVSGCTMGGGSGRPASVPGTSAPGLAALSLPDGHPPIFPEGHPPIPPQMPRALPEGHPPIGDELPRCPGGGLIQEGGRGREAGGPADTTHLIST